MLEGFLKIFLPLYIIIGACLPFARQLSVPSETDLKLEDAMLNWSPQGREYVRLLSSNEEAFYYKLEMIRRAEDSIELSTFQFGTDEAGKLLISALMEAGQRGVRVRLLIDGVTGIDQAKNMAYFKVLSQCPNCEVKMYNPISLRKPWSINGRLHDKYLLVDDRLYTLGGRNIADSFLGLGERPQKIDWDVLVIDVEDNKDRSAERLRAYFDHVWENEYAETCTIRPKETRRRKYKKADETLRQIIKNFPGTGALADLMDEALAQSVEVDRIALLVNPTTPYAKEPHVFYAMTWLMQQADENVTFHTPYIIMDQWMEEQLQSIVDQVPEVTMLTNSIANTDNAFGAADYKKNKKNILQTGLHILEYDSGESYHGKCFVIDDKWSGIGAFNWDMRSTYIDTETMLVIESEAFNAELREAMGVYEKRALVVVDEKTSIAPEGHKSLKPTLKIRFLMRFASFVNRFFRFLF